MFSAPLHCPACSRRHVDRGEWATRPHHTHECEHCGFRWDVLPYTIGAAPAGRVCPSQRTLDVPAGAARLSFQTLGLPPGGRVMALVTPAPHVCPYCEIDGRETPAPLEPAPVAAPPPLAAGVLVGSEIVTWEPRDTFQARFDGAVLTLYAIQSGTKTGQTGFNISVDNDSGPVYCHHIAALERRREIEPCALLQLSPSHS